MIDTDFWPRIQARDYKEVPRGVRRAVRVIVIHTTESLEVEGGARQIAKYFQAPDYPSSPHVVVDDKEVYQCVLDNNVAYAAPGCNADGIQIELVGSASQTPQEWSDPYSQNLLALAANVTAQYCVKYGIPAQRLVDIDLGRGLRGIVGHSQVSLVYGQSNHTDPGPNFPWDSFIQQVRVAREMRLLKYAK